MNENLLETLQSIHWDNVADWPKVIKTFVLLIVFINVAFLGFWFVTSAKLAEIEAIGAQEQELKQQFSSKYKLFKQLQSFKQQVENLTPTQKALLSYLPMTDQTPRLLDTLAEQGKKHNLVFKSFRPLPNIQHTFYIEQPIRVQMVGSYHAFAQFLSHITHLDYVVSIKDFLIKIDQVSNTAAVGTRNAELLDITVVISTYRYFAKAKTDETQTENKQ